VLGFVQVPQHSGSVLSTGSAKRSIWRDGDGVDVTCVANVVSLETAAGKLPNLDQFVPTGGDDDWVLRIWAESDTRNPLRVTLLGDGEFAVSQCVPELDSLVARTGNDLPVIGRE